MQNIGLYFLHVFCVMFVKGLDSTDRTEEDDDSIDDDAERDEDDVDETDDTETISEQTVDDYMPVRRIVSDKEQLKQHELQQLSEGPLESLVPIKTEKTMLCSIPIHLMAFAYDLSDISSFPSPWKDDETNKLGWIDIVCLFYICLFICWIQVALKVNWMEKTDRWFVQYNIRAVTVTLFPCLA